jgi:putative Holliday junction resolvase
VIPRSGRILAVDWGERRFGLAISDDTQTIASPLGTLTRRTGKRFPMPAFLAHCAAQRPIGLVVGLPLTPEGHEGPAARSARDLAALLGARTYLPIELIDERMTTARAQAAIREQQGSTRGRRGDVDALAAAILLQQYLEHRRHNP